MYICCWTDRQWVSDVLDYLTDCLTSRLLHSNDLDHGWSFVNILFTRNNSGSLLRSNVRFIQLSVTLSFWTLPKVHSCCQILFYTLDWVRFSVWWARNRICPNIVVGNVEMDTVFRFRKHSKQSLRIEYKHFAQFMFTLRLRSPSALVSTHLCWWLRWDVMCEVSGVAIACHQSNEKQRLVYEVRWGSGRVGSRSEAEVLTGVLEAWRQRLRR